MEFTLSAAAKATGKGKSTIHNAIKSGKLSARRTETGSYQIDASELARVFKMNPVEGSRLDDPEPSSEPFRTEVAVLRTKVTMLEDQLARERETNSDTLSDLRKRLDRSEERVLALTNQATPNPQESPPRRSILARLLGR